MSLCSHSVVGGVNILAKVPPLSKHQKEFLRVYIHKQRKQKAQEGCDGGVCLQSVVGFGEDGKRGITVSPSYDDETKSRADRVREQGQQLQDVKAQISSLQSKLMCLKEEKHQLFRQLKTVLNEEDEKKKVKDNEQKHSEHLRVHVPGDVGDCKVGGVKRPPPHSPGPGLPPTKHQLQRGPLLPTPEPSQLSRQNPYFWPGSGPDQANSGGGSGVGSATRHMSRSHRFSSSRPCPSEQMFGMVQTQPHDVVPAGVSYQQYNPTPPHGSVSSPTCSSSQTGYGNPTPPYGSVSSPTCNSSQTGPGPGTPFSQVGGQVFPLPLQHHPHSYQPLGERTQMPQDMPAIYPPQDVTYIAQGGPAQGMAEYSNTYQMHDPRQHRLVPDNHVPSTTPVHPQASREVRMKK